MSSQREPHALDQLASVDPQGRHKRIHPSKVSGPLTLWRNRIWVAFFIGWSLLPWWRIENQPALLFDVAGRRFFVLGRRFGAEDVWLLFFVLTGLAFALFLISALWGRAWCAYACPQTVTQELLFRPLEAMVEGRAAVRRRRDAKGWRQWRLSDWRVKVIKWVLFALLALFVGHTYLAYFVPIEEVLQMVSASPGQNPKAFAWTAGITALCFAHFLSFREQLCLAICPYGRLQSVLMDEATLQVGYDVRRGEPRQKGRHSDGGDCIDCARCVAVCPTGIDIRHGLQMECLGCMACVDACNEIMMSLGRPKGLIRYDSSRGLAGKRTRIWRPRLILYGLALVAGIVATGVAASTSHGLTAKLQRSSGATFRYVGGQVENRFLLRLSNRRGGKISVRLFAASDSPGHLVLPTAEIELNGARPIDVPVLLRAELAEVGKAAELVVEDRASSQRLKLPILGPSL